MPFFRFAILWWAIGFGMLGLVIFLSLTPAPPEIATFSHVDKLEHLLAYALLMGWFGQLVAGFRAVAGWMVGLVGLGVGLEIVQGLGGVRFFEVSDMVANASGVVLGALISRRWWPGELQRLDRWIARRLAREMT